MKKLKLNLEDLRVESFETMPPNVRGRGGTVFGKFDTGDCRDTQADCTTIENCSAGCSDYCTNEPVPTHENTCLNCGDTVNDGCSPTRDCNGGTWNNPSCPPGCGNTSDATCGNAYTCAQWYTCNNDNTCPGGGC
jgi:hypothetical protein